MSGINWNPWASAPTTATGVSNTGNGNGAQAAHQPSVFTKIKDAFSGLGLKMGFGAASNDIKQAFRKLDVQKDNHLDANEFGFVGQAFAQGTAAWGAADRNTNNEVSLGEFKTWVRAGALAEFKQADTDGNNYLDANEITVRWGTAAGLPNCDKNNDQLLSFGEYLQDRAKKLA
jgi:hypothetical protein